MNKRILLSPDEVSGILGVTPHTLAVWRSEGRYNLPYIKVGRLVRYPVESIECFLNERTVTAGCKHGQ